MAEYEISYAASKPQAPPTGGGTIEWFIQPWAREVGAPTWEIVPNTGKTAYISTVDLAAVNAMPHDTAAEKQAKNAAVVTLLLARLSVSTATVLTGQSPEILQRIIENNAAAAAEVDAINDYITVTMGQTYPVRFSV